MRIINTDLYDEFSGKSVAREGVRVGCKCNYVIIIRQMINSWDTWAYDVNV